MAPDPRFLHLHSTDINRDFIYLVFGSSNILLYICGENVRFFIVKVLVNRLESAGKLAPLFLYSILIPLLPHFSYLFTSVPSNKLRASQYLRLAIPYLFGACTAYIPSYLSPISEYI